ncbi:MAG: RHS repeat-associated core domain-containing protein [bacterium]|nr:RHS repeat-associated core domain-containing protein [bacterium]
MLGLLQPPIEDEIEATFATQCSECPPLAVLPRSGVEPFQAFDLPECSTYGQHHCIPGASSSPPDLSEILGGQVPPTPYVEWLCITTCLHWEGPGYFRTSTTYEISTTGLCPPSAGLCVTSPPIPVQDEDDDDIPSLFDEDEDTRHIDIDQDGMPDALDPYHDEYTDENGDVVPGSLDGNGLMPPDIVEDFASFQEWYEAATGSDLPDIDVEFPAPGSGETLDVNNDGNVSLGEVGAYLLGQLNNQLSATQAAVESGATAAAVLDLAEANAALGTMTWTIAAETGILDGRSLQSLEIRTLAFGSGLVDTIEEFLESGSDVVGAIRNLPAFNGDLVARFRTDPDGSPRLVYVVLDENGNEVELSDALNDYINPEASNDSQQGDPVVTGSGEFYHDAVELKAAGRGLDLEIRRIYRSRKQRMGLLGWNWSMPTLETYLTFFPQLVPGQRVAEMHWGDGRRTYFEQVDTGPSGSFLMEGTHGEFGKVRGYYNPFGAEEGCDPLSVLGGFVLREPNGTLYYFCAPSAFGGAGYFTVSYLRKIVDPYGNAITISRNAAGNPTRIVDTLGRAVTFTYHAKEGLLRSMIDWSGRTWDYTYDLEKRELLRVDYPETVHVDSAGSYVSERPFEQYTYAEHPAGWENVPHTLLNHNLSSIETGEGVVVTIQYYEDDDYQVDKVRSHTSAGDTTRYFYDAHTDPHQPEIDHRTMIRYGSGMLERYLHGNGLLYRTEVVNGRYDPGLVFMPNSADPGPSEWWRLFDYDDEFRMTSVSYTTRERYLADPHQARRTQYFYDTTNADRFQHGNMVAQHTFPDVSNPYAPPAPEQVTLFQYDPVTTKVVASTDPLGRTTTRTFGHHELDYETARTLPLLAGWEILGDQPADPSLWGRGDLNGDGAGGTYEVVQVVAPMGEIEETPGNLVSFEPVTTHNYNVWGQPIETHRPDGVVESFDYLYGMLEETTVSAGSEDLTTTLERDDLGRVTRKIHPDNSVEEFAFDARDRVIGHTRTTTGQIEHAECASFGTIASQCTDHHGITTYFFYDEAGRSVGMTRPHFDRPTSPALAANGDRTAWEFYVDYDVRGKPVAVDRYVHDAGGQVLESGQWTQTFDARGRRTGVTTPAGAQHTFDYDASGNQILWQWAGTGDDGGGSFEQFYSDFGQLELEVHPLASNPGGSRDSSSYSYDGYGHLRQEVDLAGIVQEYEVEVGGRVAIRSLKQSSDVIRQETYVYDAWDRLTREERTRSTLLANGQVALSAGAAIVDRYGYGRREAGRLWTLRDAAGVARLQTREYDDFGRLHAVSTGSSGEAVRTEYVRDSMGRVLSETRIHDDDGRTGPVSPSASTWTFSYGQYGFLARKDNPVGGYETYAHDAAGNTVLALRSNGLRRGMTWDSAGSMLSSREMGGALDRTEEFEYDLAGRLTRHTNTRNNETALVYDSLGRLESRARPGTGLESMEYDAANRLETRTGPGSLQVAYEYTTRNRVATITASGAGPAVTQTFAYNALGGVRSAQDLVAGRPTVTVSRAQSSEGWLAEEAVSGVGPSSALSIAANGAGETSELTYPSAYGIEIDRDSVGRVEALRDAGTSAVIAAFDDPYGGSQFRKVTWGTGEVQTLEFDGTGFATRQLIESSTGLPLVDRSYVYSPIGEMESRSEAGVTEAFGYDKSSRLTQWTYDSGSGVTRTVSWELDDADNFEELDDSLLGVVTPNRSDANQYTTFAPHYPSIDYDDQGNETDRDLAPGSSDLDWDSLGRPFSRSGPLGTTDYRYGPFGRLLERSSPSAGLERFRYLGSTPIEAEGAWGLRRFIVDPRGPYALASYDGLNTSYYDVDPSGNVVGVYDGTGAPKTVHYDPYGIARAGGAGAEASAADWAGEPMFAGRLYDFAHETYAFGRRIYDPTLGRFVSKDPLGERGGTNLYAYASANPLGFTDRLGLSPDREGGHREPMASNERAFSFIAGRLERIHGRFETWGGELAEAMDRFADELGVDGPVWEDRSRADQIALLESALETQRDAIGESSGVTQQDLQEGLGQLEGALTTIQAQGRLEQLAMVLDLPGTAAEFVARRAGASPELAVAVGVIAGSLTGGGARAIRQAHDLYQISRRARQVHGALDSYAQTRRTTAVLRTNAGDIVAGGSRRDLTGRQRRLLKKNEVAAELPGAHAEVTALQHATEQGLTPKAISASRPFCSDCITAIENAGGTIVTDTRAVWP